MIKDKLKSQRLLYLSTIFMLLLNYPILSAYNKNMLLGGLPLLYVSVFFLWLMMILLLVIVANK